MRKLRLKTKAEEKKVQVKHEEAISIEQRYRNMKEIVRHKKLTESEPKPAAYVDSDVLTEAEQAYQSLVYQKEEEYLQQQNDLRDQAEEIAAVEQRIRDLEAKCKEQKKVQMNTELEVLRLDDRGHLMPTAI